MKKLRKEKFQCEEIFEAKKNAQASATMGEIRMIEG